MRKLFTLLAITSVTLVYGYCPTCNAGGSYYSDQYSGGYNGQGDQSRDYSWSESQPGWYDQEGQYGNGYGRPGQYSSYRGSNPEQSGYGRPGQYSSYQDSNQEQSGYNNPRSGTTQYYDAGRQNDQDNRYRYATPQNQSNYSSVDMKKDQKAISDQDIKSKIHDKLSSGWFTNGYHNVTYDVSNGNVSLGGSVDTLDNKNSIEDSIKRIDGVKQVNNQISVVKEQPADIKR